MGNSVLGGGDNMCKGPEVDENLVWSGTRRMIRVVSVSEGDKVMMVQRAAGKWALRILCSFYMPPRGRTIGKLWKF